MLKTNIQIPVIKIEEFCRKWQIKEFSLFGSVLRKDSGPKKRYRCYGQFCGQRQVGSLRLGRYDRVCSVF